MPGHTKPLSDGARRALFLALALSITIFFALAAAGCGSDDSPDESTTASSTPAATTVDSDNTDFDAATIYRNAVPGVISVRSIFGDIDSQPLNASAATGSGSIVSDDGEIVTNAHVITDGEGEDRKVADEVYVEFTAGDVVPAEVIGFDPFADVGLLKVDTEGLDIQPLKLADSDKVVVGEPIAVIGSPFGENQSLSTGVVSQTDRSVRSLTSFQIEGAIQTDAPINPGNSGGPMIDGNGEVIGISQQIKGSSGASDGVGFGVPSNAISRSIDQLRETGEPSYAYIGVSTQALYPQLAEKLGIEAENGALVANVIEDGPAGKAGIRGGEDELTFQGQAYTAGGDVIVSVDGEEVEGAEDLGRIIGGLEPGQTIKLGIVRDGDQESVDVTLSDRPTGNLAG